MTAVRWNAMKDVPMDGTPVLLYLEETMLGSQLHVGVFHPNYKLISSRFYFECPTPLAWSELPEFPTEEVLNFILPK